MGLRDDLTADIAEAFDTDLADAVTSFAGTRVIGLGPRDPVTETRPEITETYTGRGVFGSFEINVVDGVDILRTDTKVTALQAEVTDTPKIDDTINGMKVISVGADPAKATHSIQLRKV
ncbi:hypothetical protein L1889_18305 [Paenalcaligenes niemegkensis]|uniref:hypothetical protein n=1 Tax=Paenalcaligenes niemegkensis TaxID=2895469 RepID=UPI001EE82891|nr:hypothetical protein [Paenalcaligenes niemegkensis]MCQ9618393.1 hypothetical protein [Paenalcaligenes niemegkensis]